MSGDRVSDLMKLESLIRIIDRMLCPVMANGRLLLLEMRLAAMAKRNSARKDVLTFGCLYWIDRISLRWHCIQVVI